MKQSGLAMVETLVAASLLGLGLLGASRLTLVSLDAARQTRQLEVAQGLARDALDCAVAGGATCAASSPIELQGVRYSVQMEQAPLASCLGEIVVQVQWQGGQDVRQLRWRTRRCDLPDWVGVSSP